MTPKRLKLLAIDDTPTNLMMLGIALAPDFDLQIATSGAAGLALANSSLPDLILLDVMMPEMDGFETCRRLKLDSPARDIPVFFLTALTDSESEARGLALGAADYITKPINVAIARQRILNFLERERWRKEVEAQRDLLQQLIAQRKQAEDELRIAAVAFDCQNGMVLTDPSGVILRVNRSFTRLTGYSAEEAIGQTPAVLKSGRHDESFYRRMWNSLIEKGFWQGKIWNKRKNGQIYPEMLAITAIVNPEGVATHYVASFTEITEDQHAEAEIHRLAYHDPLTRLPNRRLLQDRLRQVLAASPRSGLYGALFFIGLDNFKALNDTRGHHRGDLLLIEVAQRLRSRVREGDTVARLGGDEFVVLVDGLGRDASEAAALAQQLGDKLRAALDAPCSLDGVEHHARLSIGVTLFAGEDSVENLFKRADLALDQAKNAGRDRLRFFDPAMQEAMDLRSTLEADLRQALPLEQLRLYYQPQVDTRGRVIGVEALLRWQHPQRGLVAPNEFIPLAESTGLILPIGLWILEDTGALLKAWEKAEHTRSLQIAVNVSARQFRQADFVAQVQSVLASSGANPQRLKLELTESVVLENVDKTIAKMLAIQELGVAFSLDDFGTGYSSLSYLAQLPIDQLKIDQSFVRKLPGAGKGETIARTIITMGRELGMNVIAEGVETEAQRDFLASHGCHAYQGYLFSRPLPIAELQAFLLRPRG